MTQIKPAEVRFHFDADVLGLGKVVTLLRPDATYPVAAVRDNGARMVALSSAEATSTWAQLEILMCRWRSIEDLFALPAPLIRAASRSGLANVKLD